MSETFRISEADLTFGDLCDFEQVVGQSLSSAFSPGPEGDVRPPALAVLALVWISKRQRDPAFTLDDARKVKLTELELVPAGVDPTSGDEPTSSPPSATSGE